MTERTINYFEAREIGGNNNNNASPLGEFEETNTWSIMHN